jgi:hypothetical protein
MLLVDACKGRLLPCAVREAALLQRLGSVLAISSAMLVGNMTTAQPVRHHISSFTLGIPTLQDAGWVFDNI